MQDSATEANESRVDQILRLMRRKRRRDENADNGTWLGLGAIKQMVGGDRESVRGDLISLVARGDVEVLICINGTYWRAYAECWIAKQVAKEADDGHYVLQHELVDDSSWSHPKWFDAEKFTNRARAEAALKYAKWERDARSREYNSAGRGQRIRMISL